MVGGVADPPSKVVEDLARAAGAQVRVFGERKTCLACNIKLTLKPFGLAGVTCPVTTAVLLFFSRKL